MYCKHYTGLFGPGMVEHKECKAGHSYESFGPTQEYRRELPCMKDHNRPCPDQVFPTPEEVAAKEKASKERFKMTMTARAAIMATGAKPGDHGDIECPKCKGRLYYAIAQCNGHVRAGCETFDCIQWIE